MKRSQSMSRGRRWELALFTCLLLVLVVGVSPAAADVEVDISTPAGNRYRAGKELAMLVTVSADRATTGTVTVSYDGVITAVERFDLPGGAEKTIVVITPTPQWNNVPEVVVETGEGVKRSRPNFSTASGDELVGVLPELATRNYPETASVVAELGQARLYSIEPSLLSAGSAALEVFGSILGTEADLELLPDQEREALFSWVARGGNLYVDTASGARLSSLLPFDSSDETSQAWGFGQVTYTDQALSRGAFDNVVRPSSNFQLNSLPIDFQNGNPEVQLAADAGLKIPGIEVLLGMLGLYILVIGPGMWFFLRRRNREPLMWAAIPLLAAVTVAGVYVVGRAQRSGVQASHATIEAEINGSYSTFSHVLVASAGGGFAGVELPDGWISGISANDRFNNFGERTRSFRIQDGVLGTDLPPGGASVVVAQGASGNPQSAWAADLQLNEQGELAGTVTNLTAYTLDDVSVSLGGELEELGSLAPGQQASVTLTGDLSSYPLLEDQLLRRLTRNEWRPNTEATSGGALAKWTQRFPQARASGEIMVLGWTREAEGPLNTSRGSSVTNGRTGFLSVTNAPSAGQRVLPGGTVVRIVRDPDSTRVDDGDLGRGEFQMTVAIVLPSGAGSDELVLQVPETIRAMDVWTGSEWQPSGVSALRAQANDTILELPASSVVGDEVYLRVGLNDFFWGRGDIFPIVRSLDQTDDVQEMARG